MSAFQPRIAIVGGGPGGVALGLLLSRHGIPTTIFERRRKPTPEELAKPSGMLDLHEESGMAVMHQAGLWEGFQAAVGDCSESMRVMNPHGTIVHTDEGELASRPEIPRTALTELLLRDLPAESIKWEHKITSARSSTNDAGAVETTLEFGENGTATFDFVVGADGAWSRVRKLLSDAKPLYTGVQFITATMRHATANYPHLVEFNGTGALAALGGGNGIMTHRGPQDSIRVYAAVSSPEEHWAKATGVEGQSATELKRTLLGDDKLFKKWSPQLQELLTTACDEETKDTPGPADILPLYSLPHGHRWEHRAGVTLIGDAAHLISPFAGEGVNLALWDSLDLANALANVKAESAAAWQAALEPKLRAFEETILARAEEKSEEAVKHKDIMLGENGAQALADLFAMYAQMVDAGQEVNGHLYERKDRKD